MFNDREWKIMYNNVFKVFPSPDDIIQKIILKTDKGNKVFKSTSEFLSYICLNEKEINNDVEYTMKNDLLKNEIENRIFEVIKNIKKREV